MGHKSKGSLLKILYGYFRNAVTLSVVMTMVISQASYANPDGDNRPLDKQEIERIKRDALDFQKLTPEELKKNGIDPSSVVTMNVSGRQNGADVELDLIQGSVSKEKIKNILKVFKILEPQLKEAVQKDPNTTFRLISISNEKEAGSVETTTGELLKYIQTYTSNIDSQKERVSTQRAERLKNSLEKIFDKTSHSDIKWSMWRLVLNGSSATYSFYVSGVPVPIAMVLGYGLMGPASAGIGLFIEKFTGWLENNHRTPTTRAEKIKSRIYSIETLMMTAPLLVGLQETGLTSPETLSVLGTTAAATVVAQNVYQTIKSKFPSFGMWYKWYATEALFLTIPYLAMPAWDLYSKSGSLETILGIYMFSLFSTASQGLWDITFTNIRSPHLKKSKLNDIASIANRLNGKNITTLSTEAARGLIYKNEFALRESYKKFFFAGSVWSVTSAVLGTLGRSSSISGLEMAGYVGLGLLAASGGGIWIKTNIVTIRNKFDSLLTKTLAVVDRISPYRYDPIPISCTMLFGP